MDQVFLFAFNGELIVSWAKKKIKLKQNRQGKENALQFVNNFSPPLACQSTAGKR